MNRCLDKAVMIADRCPDCVDSVIAACVTEVRLFGTIVAVIALLMITTAAYVIKES